MPSARTSPPMTCSSTRSPSWTPSIAPTVARIPHLIWLPSKAGPAGAAVASARCALPRTISPLVPTSTNTRSLSSRTTPVASTPATMSAPTYAPSAGSVWM